MLLVLATSRKATSLITIPAELSQGIYVFQNSCASCHIGGSNVIAKERSLTKEALETFIGLEDSEDISNFIENSRLHRGALAFRGNLNDKDIADVSTYVYRQAVEEKWSSTSD